MKSRNTVRNGLLFSLTWRVQGLRVTDLINTLHVSIFSSLVYETVLLYQQILDSFFNIRNYKFIMYIQALIMGPFGLCFAMEHHRTCLY